MCSQAPQANIHVLAQPTPPLTRSDLDLDQIAEFEHRSGNFERQRPLGFYTSTFFYTVRVNTPASSVGPCPATIEVSIEMDLANRTIEIGRELQQQPCRFSATVKHYRKHAEADEVVFATYVLKVAETLHRTPVPLVPPNAAAHDAVSSWARSVVDHVLEPFSSERKVTQTAVDTPEEMRALNVSCYSERPAFL
jgi:hypothetical protein